ncbi:hypothetical protein ARHIZOSPH14_18030 [Agromyces rhizosphaerae]|uniref:DUF2254 domain-containing protein n=2 Tax=Agromyces rhizosphaerae TaxID=88374 RepID=A0A9W6CX07_9MICO|nr:hypothetical protein ARHIZOSPH14_18030 [Agromyces rhizosphaerae]
MLRRWAAFTDAFGTRLWPVPTVAVVAAVVAGLAIPAIDRAVDPDLPAALEAVLFGGGTDSARAVLSAIAGSLITATSLTFSLTVVALQLASSQASPRVLRLFAQDRMVHGTLALFLATFAYALTVLRTVDDANGDPFIPRIAVTLASVLTFASVIVLVFFLAHLARQLRVETIMRDVHRETQRTIDLLEATELDGVGAAPERPSTATTVPARRSGFLTGVDRHALIEAAERFDIVIAERRAIGSSVIEGTPLADWWPRSMVSEGRADAPERDPSEIADAVVAAHDTGYERTAAQDIGFGLRQLVDIAARALSPGVNDPTTAVHALSHLSALLCAIARLDPEPAALVDEHGVPRLVHRTHDFTDLLEVALEQPRRYGAGDPVVAARMFQLLHDVALQTGAGERGEAVREQAARLVASVAAHDYDDVERARFAAAARAVDEALSAAPAASA